MLPDDLRDSILNELRRIPLTILSRKAIDELSDYISWVADPKDIVTIEDFDNILYDI